MEELLGEISKNVKSKLPRPLAPKKYDNDEAKRRKLNDQRSVEKNLSDRIREQSQHYRNITNKFHKFDNKVKYWRFIDDRPWRKEINSKIREARSKYGNVNLNKYINCVFYNNITSYTDVKNILFNTYQRANESFKLLVSFGFVFVADEEKGVLLHSPSQNYFLEKPYLVKSRGDIDRLINKLTQGKIVKELTKNRPSTRYRLGGIYSMMIKTFKMGYLIGAPTNLPQYIKNSHHIIGLETIENNMCFFACCSLASGSRRDRYLAQAKKIFQNFYNHTNYRNYNGFDYVNELALIQPQLAFAINIVQYNEDESIEYIYKSNITDRPAVYFNLYQAHFSFITDIIKLAKAYACHICGAKFRNLYDLNKHSGKCKEESTDTFQKTDTIWTKPRKIL